MRFFDTKLIHNFYNENFYSENLEAQEEYCQCIFEASQREWSEREKVLSFLPKQMSVLFRPESLHDASISKIELKKFKSARLPELRIKFSMWQYKGTIIYKNVSYFRHDDSYTKDQFRQDCLYDELFFTSDGSIAHNYLLISMGEINIVCEKLEWKP